MQDSVPGWTRYIEELEAQAARLRHRRRPAERSRTGWAAVRDMAGRVRALFRSRADAGSDEIGG